MLNWLLRLWRKIEGWVVHPRPDPKTYHLSNLHARRRQGEHEKDSEQAPLRRFAERFL